LSISERTMELLVRYSGRLEWTRVDRSTSQFERDIQLLFAIRATDFKTLAHDRSGSIFPIRSTRNSFALYPCSRRALTRSSYGSFRELHSSLP